MRIRGGGEKGRGKLQLVVWCYGMVCSSTGTAVSSFRGVWEWWIESEEVTAAVSRSSTAHHSPFTNSTSDKHVHSRRSSRRPVCTPTAPNPSGSTPTAFLRHQLDLPSLLSHSSPDSGRARAAS